MPPLLVARCERVNLIAVEDTAARAPRKADWNAALA
jgi:hypothetical protein